MHRALVFSLLLLLLPACGDRPELWSEPLALSGPYKVGRLVLWLDGGRGLVFSLTPHAQPPRVRSATMARNVTFAAPHPDGSALLVLSAGKEALLKDQQAEEPGLTVIRPTPAGDPRVERFYPLSGAFDRLAVSADGSYAVAYHSPNQASEGVLRNPNEVALLDLSREPGADNPLLRTVRSFGSAPLGVVFSPPMTIPAGEGESRDLAIVLAEGYLTFLDLTHPERSEITVPLNKPDAEGRVTPEQVLFSPDTASVFIRARGAADIYALSLLARQAEGPTGNDYLPTVNQPSSGKVPRDMVLFSDQGRDMVLTANASDDLSLMDAATSEAVIIPLGEPVDRLLAVPAGAPTLVLAYSQAAPRARIHFVELAGLGQGLIKNVTSRSLDRPVHQLVPVPGDAQALVIHDDQRTVLSVLDLVGEHHTISPIQGNLALTSFDFVADTASGPFLVASTPGRARLGLLQLSNLHSADLRLDDFPQQLLVVEGAIVVVHASPVGQVTVVPGPEAERAECHVLHGLFLDGLLDHELED